MKPGKPTPPPSNHEIIGAIKIIQETCKTFNDLYGNCNKCPLRTSDDHCGLFANSNGDQIYNPLEWETIKPETPYRILLH